MKSTEPTVTLQMQPKEQTCVTESVSVCPDKRILLPAVIRLTSMCKDKSRVHQVGGSECSTLPLYLDNALQDR